jgi:hypothetical protein
VGHLTRADPVAAARAWLLTRQSVTDALGGPDRIGADNVPPYPCVVLTDPPGDDRFLRHLVAPILQVEVLGDMDGSPGKPVLREILFTVLEELVALSDSVQTDPTVGVVTAVTSSGGGGWVPLPTGQPRYLATVQIHMHPPLAPVE